MCLSLSISTYLPHIFLCMLELVQATQRPLTRSLASRSPHRAQNQLHPSSQIFSTKHWSIHQCQHQSLLSISPHVFLLQLQLWQFHLLRCRIAKRAVLSAVSRDLAATSLLCHALNQGLKHHIWGNPNDVGYGPWDASERCHATDIQSTLEYGCPPGVWPWSKATIFTPQPNQKRFKKKEVSITLSYIPPFFPSWYFVVE